MKEAWMYDHNADNTCRYTLGHDGPSPLICIGINPSTATPEKLDNTVNGVHYRAERQGFDGWIMLNVYPQRATDPKNLDALPDMAEAALNLEACREVFSRHPGATVWAAWGTILLLRPYLRSCLLDILEAGKPYGMRWVHCGPISKAGHPHHPLYLKKDAPLEPFDVENYLAMLSQKCT